jgi:hypothetical protein
MKTSEKSSVVTNELGGGIKITESSIFEDDIYRIPSINFEIPYVQTSEIGIQIKRAKSNITFNEHRTLLL